MLSLCPSSSRVGLALKPHKVYFSRPSLTYEMLLRIRLVLGHGKVWRDQWMMRLIFHDERRPSSRNCQGDLQRLNLITKIGRQYGEDIGHVQHHESKLGTRQ